MPNHKLKKLRELSYPERYLLIQSVVLLPLTGLALRVLGFRRCHSIIARLSAVDKSETGATAIGEAKAAARLVKIAARHGLYRAKCLAESLVLWSLLKRRGQPVELRIGTRKHEDQFEAHAWVELDGGVLNDTDDVDQRFTSFDQPIFPAGAKLG